MSLKAVVFGNCQARPLAAYLANGEIDVMAVGIVHLLKDSDFANYEKALRAADLIIAQQVATNYPCKFVTRDWLTENYKNKTLFIINLYYAAYNPELIYVRLSTRTLRGPLGDYHFEPLVAAWAAQMPVKQAVEILLDYDINGQLYRNAPSNGVEELKRREREGAVSVTDIIEARWLEEKLFHTMNHPTNALLADYACRIAESAGTTLTPSLVGDEHLGQFRVPTNAFIRKNNNIRFDDQPLYRGASLSFDLEKIALGASREYSAEELVDAFFAVYDNDRVPLLEWISTRPRIASLVRQLSHRGHT